MSTVVPRYNAALIVSGMYEFPFEVIVEAALADCKESFGGVRHETKSSIVTTVRFSGVF